ncbi:MAG: carbohydrate ABC transporter permease, partial [Firmicutes bacterium]|nr:carbohydrate ABC transporter permease [Bacillota bacterium]
PDDLVDAATIDGASELRTFAQIVLPLSKPILATLTIFIFLGVWNDFMWPYIVITTTEKQPLMVAIYNSVFKSAVFAQNDIMAAITIAILPPIAVFFALQKHITRGITLTGLKG